MARRNLLQPVRYQAERRQLAAARRETFVDPPVRQNRVWQADFTQFETTSEGTWRLCGVVDYATKLALACPVTTTQGANDLIGALQSAIDTAEALLGRRLIEDCIDPATGEIVPLVVVTDNAPAMKSVALARWFAARSRRRDRRSTHRYAQGSPPPGASSDSVCVKPDSGGPQPHHRGPTARSSPKSPQRGIVTDQHTPRVSRLPNGS